MISTVGRIKDTDARVEEIRRCPTCSRRYTVRKIRAKAAIWIGLLDCFLVMIEIHYRPLLDQFGISLGWNGSLFVALVLLAAMVMPSRPMEVL